MLKTVSHLPVIVDPSHAAGVRSLVPVLSRAAAVVGADGLIVEVHPAWRGYMYFVVNDEIVIVEPSTLKIVAVIT